MIRRHRVSEPAPSAGSFAREGSAMPARAALVLALAVLASTLVVDLRAESAFDSPKRLAASLGILVAAAFVFGRVAWTGSGRIRSFGPEPAVLAFVTGAAFCAVSTLASPRPALALDGLRGLALGALLVALGASSALDEGRIRLVATGFLAGCVLNAGTTMLQVSGLKLFGVQSFAGRADTGAFLGNDGYVGLLLAFGCVLLVGLAVTTTAPRLRMIAGLSSVLLFSGMATNRSVTAFLALGAGSLTVLVGRFRGRALVPLFAFALVLTSAIFGWSPLRVRVLEVARDAFSGNWEEVVSHRFGPWSAASEMLRERPLVGWGPGTFAAEYAPHRLKAEMRNRARYVNPSLPGDAYTEAHCDMLQSLAEWGAPAALAVLFAFGVVVFRLVNRIGEPGGRGAEALVILSLLVAAVAAAATWFPFQRAFSSAPLLLTIGRGWRVGRGRE